MTGPGSSTSRDAAQGDDPDTDAISGSSPSSTSGNRKAAWVLVNPGIWILPVVVGAVARIAYWVAVTPTWVPNSDADQYLRVARALAGGEGYSLVFPQLEMHATAFRPPFYPFVLAVPGWLFGDGVLWPSRLLSLGMGLAVVGLTVVYVRRLSGPLAGLVAGLAVALMPSLIANDTVTLTEPLALGLMLALLLAIEFARPVLAGILMGLLLLTRPNAYLVVVVVVIALWRLVGWKRAAISLVMCLTLIAPWMIRNAIQVGTPRLTTSEGFNLAAIYSPPAQARGGFVDPVFDVSFDEVRLLQFDEALWNDELTSLAIDNLREHPGYVIDVIQRNLVAFFELDPATNDQAETLDGRNLDFRHATLPIFYVYLVVGLGGLVVRARDPRLWPALAVVAQFVVLSLLLVSPPRLRAPFDLLLCVGVGIATAWVADRRSGRSVDRQSPSCEDPDRTPVAS